MKRNYETIFVLLPTLGEEGTKEVVEKFKSFIEKNATLGVFDEWGNKKLAYSVGDNTEGYYIYSTFEAEPTFPQELERVYKISEEVIKFIVVKKDR
ncbi:MAG: 30S ribosomal protein S6 [Clostridiales bacterium]|nr:30S ribosomal protein S6 [Clostridiales bacterium]